MTASSRAVAASSRVAVASSRVTAASSRAVAAAHALDQPAFITIIDDPGAAPGGVADGAGGLADGPLAGMPVAVKDNIDVAGVPTTAACPARTRPALADAVAVARLRAAGAVIVGKTNLDQFATGLVGTRSPYGACHAVASADHLSGGSSSGSAVAVAAGIVPLALGTDTAGSGRVPAAFNGLVGVKPTRGLVPTEGVLPACPSLDCVTTLTRDVATARLALAALTGTSPGGPTPNDPFGRARPAGAPEGVAARMQVVAVPAGPLDLDDAHAAAWERALAHAAAVAHLVPVDVEPFLAAARLLYEGAFVAERFEAFGHELTPDGPHLDPVVRTIVIAGADHPAAAVFATSRRLAALRAAAMPAFVGADALLLPVTPLHPTLADVAADPVGVNARLGTYTNMVNLLDLCAVAVPAGVRDDGLPFGVQLIAPAFADGPLLDLAARWLGEPCPPARPTGVLLAVAGAHLVGQPANPELVRLGGRLHARSRTAPGYRLFRVPGPLPRPGLVPPTFDGPMGSGVGPVGSGVGPADGGPGIEVEVWDLPGGSVTELLGTVGEPLAFGRLRLADGSSVLGFLATGRPDPTAEITHHGGWRAYLASLDRERR